MTCKWTRVALCLVPAACSLVLSGCARPVSANSRFYMLQAPRPAAPAVREGKAVLAVPRFTIDAAYANRGLVYRLDEHRYESDAYNEFLVSPTVMITERTRDWLAQSGLFAQVLGSGSGAEPTHRMEANIAAIYGDFRDKRAPKAVMEIRFFLLRIEGGADPVIVMAKSYAATADVATAGPEGLVAGLDRCLQTILTELEKDLAGAV
ncbi:MAG: ABC-type transport auxiliary lipoprotein family protein [Sedimentisphaerales bacterium]|jgi:cholesterol transport system auxiliary component|nr:ABC-type transport auxiliary lipoprotein family protein [Sedimentisphaerales bacterium]HNY78892.1 ABC-type transport auxiliary lipoprotein family protein [Sedimentisphaerales bacterium]HOC63049.1 ABC-type transport auxiliary lipoprotein family protein [Sedimentisphaerales bacterium]HOH64734.1 ABC-type transport auxiliary lipoprotein family protein [Sedimentisphaerales bacterium]HPY50800.1 ABC-type transport auxiliary lipoprotein family protein [Sedimentisphaerales bacterium]